jgi:hypothetical protein
MVALVPVDLHEADAYRRRQDHSTDREVLHAAHVCQQASGLDACRRRKRLIPCAPRLTKMVNVWRLFTIYCIVQSEMKATLIPIDRVSPIRSAKEYCMCDT